MWPPNWKRKQRRERWNCAGAQPWHAAKLEQGGRVQNVVSGRDLFHAAESGEE